MAPASLQILCLALVLGSLVGTTPCHGSKVDGRNLLQVTATSSSSASSSGGKNATASSKATASSSGGKNSSSTATATSDDGVNTVTVTTSDGNKTETATSTSVGGPAEASVGTGGTGGSGSATSSPRPSGPRPSDKEKILEPLNEIIAEIYITVAERVADNGDPELAARALVDSRSFQIAAVWKSVINADGRRGRSPACQDRESFAEAQEAEFAQALVDAFEIVKGGRLSDGAIDDITDTIDTLMDRAFGDAAKAACGFVGFTIVTQFSFAKELKEPVYKAVLIAFGDDDPVTENGDDDRNTRSTPPNGSSVSAMSNSSSVSTSGDDDGVDLLDDDATTDGDDGGEDSVVVGITDGDDSSADGEPSRCRREFIVCCLDRKILSGVCDCLLERCDARLEDGIWVDRSGVRCHCR